MLAGRLDTKFVADFLTLSRALIAIMLTWLSWFSKSLTLPGAVWLLIASWTTDLLDGRLARIGPGKRRTWIGEHDLQIDMAVSGGVLVYLFSSGSVGIWSVASYLLIWGLIFWNWGLLRSLGMLFQAPIYGWFLWTAILDRPTVGLWMVLWVIFAIVLTWPQFTVQVIPEFLAGMKKMFERTSRN